MHYRRLSSLLLGAWLAGTLLAALFSTQNVRVVDQLIRTPAKEAAESMVKVQESDLRLLMTYHASEGNRWLRESWELAQFGLGAALLLSLFLSAGGRGYTKVVCLFMIASVTFQYWFLGPEIAKLAQSAGFVPPEAASLARDRLRTLESGYWMTQMLTLVLGLLLAWGLLRRVRRRQEQEID